MSQSKPVLVSDAEPLKRIVTETRCGRIFRSNDPASFAEELLKLKNDKDKLWGKMDEMLSSINITGKMTVKISSSLYQNLI